MFGILFDNRVRFITVRAMKSVYIAFRSEPDVAAELRRLARTHRRSLSKTIMLILRDWLNKPDRITRKCSAV